MYPIILETEHGIEFAAEDALRALGIRRSPAEVVGTTLAALLPEHLLAARARLPWPEAGAEATREVALPLLERAPEPPFGSGTAATEPLRIVVRGLGPRRSRRLIELQLPAPPEGPAVGSPAPMADFVATLAHECRNPLNAIMGSTSLLLEVLRDEEQASYAQLAHRAAEMLLRLINSLLDLKRIEAGTLEGDLRPFHLVELLENVVELVAMPARRRGTDIHLDVDPGVGVHLLADGARVEQVVLNLASNAVKFTEKGRIDLRATQSPGTTPDSVVTHVAVRDTGPGIPGHAIARLFRPFEQLSRDPKQRRDGAGLGLAISRRLARWMGGDLVVESVLGEGSTFTFTFPARRVDPGQTRTVVRRRRSAVRGRHILVLGTSDGEIRQIRQFATQWGIEAQGATRVVQAAMAVREARAKGDPVEIVVVDQRIVAGMTSDFVAMCRPAASDCSPVFVWLVDAEERELARELLSSFANSLVLRRPFRHEQLLQRLASAAELVTGRTGLSSPPDLDLASRAPAPTGQGPLPAAGGVSTAGDLPRILVVDDQPDNLIVARAALEAIGYTADLAADGREAVERAIARPYLAVLLDLSMPGWDGFETAAALRAARPSATPRLVALTGHVDEDTAHRCRTAGMDDILAKPIDRRRLAEVLTQVRGAAAQPLAPPAPPAPPIQTTPLARMPPLDPAATDPMSFDAPAEEFEASPLLDRAALEKLVDLVGEQEAETLLPTLARSLAEELPGTSVTFREHLGRGDHDAIERLAHMIQSRAGNLGLRRLQHLCTALQRAHKARDRVRFEALASRWGEVVVASVDQVRRLLDDLAG